MKRFMFPAASSSSARAPPPADVSSSVGSAEQPATSLRSAKQPAVIRGSAANWTISASLNQVEVPKKRPRLLPAATRPRRCTRQVHYLRAVFYGGKCGSCENEHCGCACEAGQDIDINEEELDESQWIQCQCTHCGPFTGEKQEVEPPPVESSETEQQTVASSARSQQTPTRMSRQ